MDTTGYFVYQKMRWTDGVKSLCYEDDKWKQAAQYQERGRLAITSVKDYVLQDCEPYEEDFRILM